MTKIVHCKKESFDIYIGRPSRWGNPFSHKEGTLAKFKVSTRQEAIDKYREWILTQPELLNSLHELKDKTLGCWCKPQSCHGDVLVELLNKKPRCNYELAVEEFFGLPTDVKEDQEIKVNYGQLVGLVCFVVEKPVMPNSEPNPERSVATEGDSSNEAGNQKH